MAKTGFFDADQQIYLPKDTLTWANLGSSPYGNWDSYTSWYKNLSSSTTVEFTTAIHDLGSPAKKVVPTITLFLGRDGDPDADVSLPVTKPTYTFEGSNVADLSSGVTTVTCDPNTNSDVTTIFNAMPAIRYIRTTININSGLNTAPQGIRGFSINFLQGDGNTSGYLVAGLPDVFVDAFGNIKRRE